MAHVQDDEAYAILGPVVDAAINQAPASSRFSTKGFIEFIRSTPEGDEGYQSAMASIMDEGGP